MFVIVSKEKEIALQWKRFKKIMCVHMFENTGFMIPYLCVIVIVVS